MAGNTVTLEFAGDSDKLTKAGNQADKTLDKVGKSATSAASDFDNSAKSSTGFTDKIGKLGAGVQGMSGAFDDAGSAVQAFADLSQQGAEKTSRMNRALIDVAQAQEDYNQALRDSKQASIDANQSEVDLEQARLNQATALKDLNTAVHEHGRGSLEARQAQIDLKQAGVDVTQAQEDAAQATRDNSQAAIDARGAVQDLSDAQREAKPPDVQKWADQINTFTPILSGLVGIVGLVTAAQWAWNAAQLANPIGLIIVAVAALVAVIILIATKTDWFQRLWSAAWGGIKAAASAVGSWFRDTLWGKWIKGAWDSIQSRGQAVWSWISSLPGRIRSAFANVNAIISAPFRAGFNAISSAWNNTVGRLHWSVPGWVPGLGGLSVAAPTLPRFHQGGTVPGPAGSEMLAVLQAGETVSPAGDSGMVHTIIYLDRDVLVDAVTKGQRLRFG